MLGITRIELLDGKVLSKPASYLSQCGLATVTLFGILILQDAVFSPVIVVAVASSAFTIFIFPFRSISTPRKVMGGHAVAITTALAILGLSGLFGVAFNDTDLGFMGNMGAALSVGISALIMVATNTEHPPAAGTAFGLVIHPFSLSAIIFIVSSVIILSVVKYALRSKLIDLV